MEGSFEKLIALESEELLDNPAWWSLTGAHAHFAQGHGQALRYQPEISPFHAIANVTDPQSWTDLAELVGPEGSVALFGRGIVHPKDWTYIEGGVGVQMTGENVKGKFDPESLALSDSDVPEMLDLVARAQPGPFAPGTIKLGGYIGFRDNGKLVAMAGCRLNAGKWREISAVCTEEAYRGRGLAARLVLGVVAAISADGQIPFLHASETNLNAIRLYETLGFKHRTKPSWVLLQPPAKSAD